MQIPDVIAGALLKGSETRAQNTVEVVVDGGRFDVGLLEVLGIDLGRGLLQVDGEANVGGNTELGGSLAGPKSEAATSGEEIDDRDRAAPDLEFGPNPLPQFMRFGRLSHMGKP
jgi:hypothetical protein